MNGRRLPCGGFRCALGAVSRSEIPEGSGRRRAIEGHTILCPFVTSGMFLKHEALKMGVTMFGRNDWKMRCVRADFVTRLSQRG